MIRFLTFVHVACSLDDQSRMKDKAVASITADLSRLEHIRHSTKMAEGHGAIPTAMRGEGNTGTSAPFTPMKSFVSEGQVDSEDTECVHDRELAFQRARERKACTWFFHTTHTGGTTLVSLAEKNGFPLAGNFPKFEKVCAGDPKDFGKKMYQDFLESWLPNRTEGLRSGVPCERNDFVSIITVRDPLSRIMSGDGMWNTNAENKFGNLDKCHADNYGLRKLIGKKDGNLTWDDVNFAKRRLRSFDVIIDMNSYKETALPLCGDLGWRDCYVEQKKHADPKNVYPVAIYDQLSKKNEFEIDFYEYAKQLAVKRARASQAAHPVNTSTDAVHTMAANQAGHVVMELSDAAEKWIC